MSVGCLLGRVDARSGYDRHLHEVCYVIVLFIPICFVGLWLLALNRCRLLYLRHESVQWIVRLILLGLKIS